jgi:hypothetical protein
MLVDLNWLVQLSAWDDFIDLNHHGDINMTYSVLMLMEVVQECFVKCKEAWFLAICSVMLECDKPCCGGHQDWPSYINL